MQTAFRAMMKFLGQQWAGIASIDKATWEVLAAAKNYSPFNAFVSANQRNWASYLAPSKNSPPTRIGTAPTVVAASGSGGIRMATLSQTTTLLNDGWGTIIFRKLGADPSMTLDEVVAVIETAGNALELKYVDTPLVPGTYHYNVIHFTNDGSFDGPGTAVPLTVT
jgi:hypothetical protein